MIDTHIFLHYLCPRNFEQKCLNHPWIILYLIQDRVYKIMNISKIKLRSSETWITPCKRSAARGTKPTHNLELRSSSTPSELVVVWRSSTPLCKNSFSFSPLLLERVSEGRVRLLERGYSLRVCWTWFSTAMPPPSEVLEKIRANTCSHCGLRPATWTALNF